MRVRPPLLSRGVACKASQPQLPTLTPPLTPPLTPGECLQPQLLEMFGMQGELAPDWDSDRKYALPALAVYAPYKQASTGAETFAPIAIEQPLMKQLRLAQSDGYRIPGVPTLMVVVRGSGYESRFITPKLRA